MAKRRRKKRTSKAQSSAALRRNGLSAFKQGDFDRAIETWERVARQTPTMRPTSALAEAYFRRGLNQLYGESPNPAAGLGDLEKANALQAGDTCYTYHLGLAHHHQGELAAAALLYREARQDDGPLAARAAYPLALALLQDGKSPLDDPVWSDLSGEEQSMLRDVGAFRRRPYALTPETPALWRYLVALDNGQHEEAQAGLEQALAADPGRVEQGVVHYYLGVLAAQREDLDQASYHWDQALQSGVDQSRLAPNLGELSHRLAEERLASDDPAGALAAAQQASRLNCHDKRLGALMSNANQRLAYQAALAGQWQTALDKWGLAAAKGGQSFRLAYNLALAHERVENYTAAGDMWREALRRRPRKADHPDAISGEQVARLWQQAAGAYRQTGDYEEAIKVYRQAVKWNPDNLEARLALAEELVTDGRGQAAENELNRILERDPDNVPALLRMGEVIAEYREWWQQSAAIKCWERVLDLEPDQATAKQLLVDYFINMAESSASWGNYLPAAEQYRQALPYQPTNSQILAPLAYCCFQANQDDLAEEYLAQALAHAGKSLDAYDAIIYAWIRLDKAEQAWRAMAQAETRIPAIPYEFYLFQAESCMRQHRVDLARPWLDRAQQQAPPDISVLGMIGEMATMAGEFELGREYLNQALAAGDYPGQSHLMLGVLEAKEEKIKAAEKHWKQAGRIARQTKDQELEERIDNARLVFTDPFNLMERMMRGIGGLPFPPLDLFEDFDDDEDDDDFFWE